MLIKSIICFSLEVKNHQENEGRLLFLMKRILREALNVYLVYFVCCVDSVPVKSKKRGERNGDRGV
jgi:hypothetical protein